MGEEAHGTGGGWSEQQAHGAHGIQSLLCGSCLGQLLAGRVGRLGDATVGDVEVAGVPGLPFLLGEADQGLRPLLLVQRLLQRLQPNHNPCRQPV